MAALWRQGPSSTMSFSLQEVIVKSILITLTALLVIGSYSNFVRGVRQLRSRYG